jgi:hypothetical protein
MKKPTGRTGENGDRICQCIVIKKNIMRKTHSGFLGVSSDEDDVATNVLLGSADEGGWTMRLMTMLLRRGLS